MSATAVEEFLQRLRRSYPLWAQSVFMIRDKRNDLAPLRLNEVQSAIGLAEEIEIRDKGQARIYVLKARQGGVSTDQQARSLHTIWGTPGAVVMTLAHSRDDTDKLFQITRRAVQNFPRELLPTLGRSETKEVTFPGLDSHFWTGTAGSKRVGRGITLTRVHGSEFAFWENPRGVLSNITPALIPRGSVVVLETTPDQYGSEAHKFWEETQEGQTGYTPVFFPWWKCDALYYRTALMEDDELGKLEEDEQLLVAQHNLDHEQLKWRRGKIKEMGRSEFMREYPEDAATCWITGGNKFYDSDIIQVLLRKTPVVRETALQGRLKIYDDRMLVTNLGVMYEDVIIGCDVSEGVGGDSSTWTARSYPSWRLLSQFKCNKTEPNELADFLNHWGRESYGEALLVVEKNAHGITVLRRLRDHHKYPRRSIYHRTPLGEDFDVKTDYIGWTTTGESKPLMLDYGRSILKAAGEGLIGVPSRETLVDFWAVTDGVLNSRDLLVSEMLAWAGREYSARRKVVVGKPVHW